MTEPIVFVSHSRVIEGQLNGLRDFLSRGVPGIERDKPRTRAFLPYLDQDQGMVTIIHVFADPESMSAHFEGLGERMAAAAPFIETVAYDVYGQPEPSILGMLEGLAKGGVSLTVRPEFLAGFLRFEPA